MHREVGGLCHRYVREAAGPSPTRSPRWPSESVDRTKGRLHEHLVVLPARPAQLGFSLAVSA